MISNTSRRALMRILQRSHTREAHRMATIQLFEGESTRELITALRDAITANDQADAALATACAEIRREQAQAHKLTATFTPPKLLKVQ